MTDPNYTAVALLVDRSGSMAAIRADAEGAVRQFVADLIDGEGKCTVRISDFSSEQGSGTGPALYPWYADVCHSVHPKDAPVYDLRPRGGTALYDAMGRLIDSFGQELAALPEDQRPGHVIVVIQTDGEENSSREMRKATVRAMVEHQIGAYGWEFIYLGANQDAMAEGASMGIPRHSTMAYAGDGGTYAASTKSAGEFVANTRSGVKGAFTDDQRKAASGG